jgi:hypothetical protein
MKVELIPTGKNKNDLERPLEIIEFKRAAFTKREISP